MKRIYFFLISFILISFTACDMKDRRQESQYNQAREDSLKKEENRKNWLHLLLHGEMCSLE